MLLEAAKEPLKELAPVETLNCRTMEEVEEFLGFSPEHAITSLAYFSEKGTYWL